MTETTRPAPGSVDRTRRGLYLGLLALVFNGLAGHANVMAQTSAKASVKPITIVALGDSLTAGYQLNASDSYPAQLGQALKAKGHNVTIVNAGVSGDTTAAGLDRLAWAVPADADGVIVALGANDMLRGLDPAKARDNLDRILTTLKSQKKDLLVVGMQAATSLPPDYRKSFDSIFPDLAAKHGAILYPFFLDGIALDPKLNLKDGMHPNRDGVAVMVRNSLPKVEQLLARIAARRGG